MNFAHCIQLSHLHQNKDREHFHHSEKFPHDPLCSQSSPLILSALLIIDLFLVSIVLIFLEFYIDGIKPYATFFPFFFL